MPQLHASTWCHNSLHYVSYISIINFLGSVIVFFLTPIHYATEIRVKLKEDVDVDTPKSPTLNTDWSWNLNLLVYLVMYSSSGQLLILYRFLLKNSHGPSTVEEQESVKKILRRVTSCTPPSRYSICRTILYPYRLKRD